MRTCCGQFMYSPLDAYTDLCSTTLIVEQRLQLSIHRFQLGRSVSSRFMSRYFVMLKPLCYVKELFSARSFALPLCFASSALPSRKSAE